MDIEKVAKAVRENTGEELPELEEALRQLEELRGKREYEKRRDGVVADICKEMAGTDKYGYYSGMVQQAERLYDAGYRKVTPLTDEQKDTLIMEMWNDGVRLSSVIDAVEAAILGE